MIGRPRYASFAELAAHEREGRDYRWWARLRDSELIVIAPHGGAIEPGTSEIADAIAGEEFSVYCFEGMKPHGNRSLHIRSTRFDEPHGVDLVTSCRMVVAIHGCAGWTPILWIGGRHIALATTLIAALNAADFKARTAKRSLAASSPDNVCNRGVLGRGVQIEVSAALRHDLFAGLGPGQRSATRPAFDRLVSAVRGVLLATPDPGAGAL